MRKISFLLIQMKQLSASLKCAGCPKSTVICFPSIKERWREGENWNSDSFLSDILLQWDSSQSPLRVASRENGPQPWRSVGCGRQLCYNGNTLQTQGALKLWEDYPLPPACIWFTRSWARDKQMACLPLEQNASWLSQEQYKELKLFSCGGN